MPGFAEPDSDSLVPAIFGSGYLGTKIVYLLQLGNNTLVLGRIS